jgi:hypothetical protein
MISHPLTLALLRSWMGEMIDAFSPRTRNHVLTLLAGTLLTPGRRTVAAALRVMGLGQVPTFTSYHRVLNRNTWSSRDLARRLLMRLLRTLVPPAAPVIVGLDDTLERRRGAVRRHVTLITRLRLDANLFAPPPPRRKGQNGRPRRKGERLPKLDERLARSDTPWRRVTITDWYGEGERTVEIASETAVWFHAGLPVVPLRWVLVRDPERTFKPQAFLCTDEAVDPVQILQWFVLQWFVLRWRLEVTFEEARRHLGLETQRQWTDKAIARTTPALLALFSLVTLWAGELLAQANHSRSPRQASWYAKPNLTFSDALAAVRYQLWRAEGFAISDPGEDLVKVPRALVERLTDTLCYAA